MRTVTGAMSWRASENSGFYAESESYQDRFGCCADNHLRGPKQKEEPTEVFQAVGAGRLNWRGIAETGEDTPF